MKKKAKPAPRCAEVLELLKKHSALSSGSIRLLLGRTLSRRRVLDILDSLHRQGIIHKRTLKTFGGHAVFYELSAGHRLDLGIPRVYWGTLPHNDYCSLVHGYLERNFPNATFFREHAIGHHEHLREVMAFEQSVPDAIPDILMCHPADDSAKSIYVAIEVERMAKSEIRILHKFSKYAMRTNLDGVIYLSEDASLLRLLRSFYQTRIATEARRTAHYSKHFLLTGDCPTRSNFKITDLQNSDGVSVSISEWMQKLTSTPSLQRRDSMFGKPSPAVVAERVIASGA